MNDFLPKDYDVPVKSSNYMKFTDGENRLRILASPILGWEWWIDTTGDDGKKIRKPMRVVKKEDVPTEYVDTAKHFWAMKVWNYQEKSVQILELTQATIQKPLRALAKDEDWGSPFGYDIVVTRTGKDLDTEYQVQPKPAKKLDEAIQEICDNVPVKLGKLYEGGDPFQVDEEEVDADEIAEGIEAVKK